MQSIAAQRVRRYILGGKEAEKKNMILSRVKDRMEECSEKIEVLEKDGYGPIGMMTPGGAVIQSNIDKLNIELFNLLLLEILLIQGPLFLDQVEQILVQMG